MMLKRSTTKSKPSSTARLVRAGLASVAAASAVAALATGCLDRPVVKASPKTSNVFVDQIVQTAVDKIDLLFMIDNSVSMADKQEILKDAVPVLVSRLVDPICVSASTGLPTSPARTNSMGCANGDVPEFNPIGDIHIGIVSSSIGSHGGLAKDGAVCASGAATDTLDDKARLIGTMRPPPGGTPNPNPVLNFDVTRSWNSLGFLAWDPSGTRNGNIPGIKVATTLETTFQDMIVATGEHGCGYEAQLESWYRFLIDPEPPAAVTIANINGTPTTVRGSKLTLDATGKNVVLDASGNPTCTGCDDTLLAQRKAFLRPDSLVAVVVLSDENDCSIRDDGVGWFVGASARMPRSTSECDANPNDPCCRSCAQNETAPPKGCNNGPLTSDPICKNVPAGQSYVTWDANHDSLNLRCYNQRRRFGFDLLYETQRYVDGLTKKTLPLQSNPAVTVTNPLYRASGTDAPRDPSLVFLAGIVGVPWQDIADDASLAGAGLTYLTAKELLAKDRWSALLGDPTASPPVPPTDPFMRESTDERSGTNTIANVKITPDTGPTNAINGHEQKVCKTACADAASTPDDLQYACIFKLKTPKTCTNGDPACDCSPDKSGNSQVVTDANSPLCQGGATINTQVAAKGYPGARELQVLKDLGNNAIVASICPKVVNSPNPSSDPNYGYNPAVGAIIERLKEALKGKCLPRPIETDAQGQVLCKVIEAQANKTACGDCSQPGRAVADPNIISAVEHQLQQTGNCGNAGQPACSTWCECEIKQELGPDLATCQSNGALTSPGYCYVDAAHNAELVSHCPSNEPQLLRFVNADADHKTPAQGAVAFIACLGAPVNATPDGGM